jgi:hypothetical protein
MSQRSLSQAEHAALTAAEQDEYSRQVRAANPHLYVPDGQIWSRWVAATQAGLQDDYQRDYRAAESWDKIRKERRL